jgi:hypothetical protein
MVALEDNISYPPDLDRNDILVAPGNGLDAIANKNTLKVFHAFVYSQHLTPLLT